jgi:hypothetical protein
LQRRIILAATALAAALVVPTVASATDKEVGPGDKPSPPGMENRAQGAGGSSTSQAVGGQGSNSAQVGQIGGAPSTVGSTPTGQAGGDGTTPAMESAITCAPAKSKTPKDPAKTPKGEAHGDKTTSDVPKGDDEAALEAELREQQELLDQLTDLLNQMQQRNRDVTRSITNP